MSRLASFTATIALAAALLGAASPLRALDVNTAAADADDYDEYAPLPISDPFEPVNRAVFKFNDVTYAYVITPAIKGYEFIVRPPINEGIANFYHNVRYPVRLLNDLLQGKFARAGLETEKFYINTIAGLGGFIRQSDNIPSIANVPREDFGQTLGVWGVPHGPYVMVPVFGGHSLRDLGGRLGDSVASPTGWQYLRLGKNNWTEQLDWEWQIAIPLTDTMSTMPGALDTYRKMKKSAIDPYLSVRDGIRRYRDAETAR